MYTVDVRSILEDLGDTLQLTAEMELPILGLGPECYEPLRPARIDASVTNTGTGVVVSGTISTEVRAACSRCLRLFPLEVIGEVDGFYITTGNEAEIPEEQEYGYIVDGSIDVADQLMAALVLALPFAPLHDENCPGICPHCGADLVDGPCACAPDTSRSPFAALGDLLPHEGDS